MKEYNKVIIAGTRSFNDYDLLDRVMQDYLVQEIVSGTAKGADKLGELYAYKNNLPIKMFPADWDTYGKRAGFLRNSEMAEYCDFAVIFWDSYSSGTRNMMKEMKKVDKPYLVIKYNESDDEWN